MNPTAITRVAWREYRQQQLIWLVMVSFTGLLLLFTSAITLKGSSEFSAVLMVGSLLTGLYALVVSTIMFAGEKDAGSQVIWQRLPVDALTVMLGKMMVGTLACMAFISLTVLACLFLVDFDTPLAGVFEDSGWFLVLFALPTAELFCWGLLYSLLMRRTILCIVLSYLTWAFTLVLITLGTYEGATALGRESAFLDHPLVTVNTGRIALLPFLIVIDIWLALRWLDPPRLQSGLRRRRTATNANSASQTLSRLGMGVAEGVWFGRYGRFMWQSIRSDGLSIGVILTAAIALILFCATRSAELPAAVVCVLAAALLGSLSFRVDHRQCGLRFLSVHCNNAKWHWAGRISITLALTLMALGTLALAPKLELSNTNAQELLGPIALCVIGSFCVAQLVSVYCRSAVVTLFFAVVFSGIFSGWVLLVWWMALPKTWSILPIIAAALLSSLWMCYRWLNQRDLWTHKLVTALPVITVLLFLAAYVPIHRVNEIPPVRQPVITGLADSDKELQRGDESPILELESKLADIVTASSQFKVEDKTDYWISEGSKLLPLLGEIRSKASSELISAEAARESGINNYLSTWERYQSGALYDAENWQAIAEFHLSLWYLGMQFQKHGVETRIDSSALDGLDRHILRAPSDLLAGTAKELQIAEQYLPSLEMWIATRLDDPNDKLYSRESSRLGWLPFEKSRANRLKAQWVNEVALYTNRDPETDQIVVQQRIYELNPRLLVWSRSTAGFGLMDWRLPIVVSDYFDLFLQLRMTACKLALVAYAKDHNGIYPTSWDELVPEYLHTVPLDPFTGTEFFYSATGMDLPLIRYYTHQDYSFVRANRPFFLGWGRSHVSLRIIEQTLWAEPGTEDSQQTNIDERVFTIQTNDNLVIKHPNGHAEIVWLPELIRNGNED